MGSEMCIRDSLLGESVANLVGASAFTPLGSGVVSEGSVVGDPGRQRGSTHGARSLPSRCVNREVERGLARSRTMPLSSAGPGRKAGSDVLGGQGAAAANESCMHAEGGSSMHASQLLKDVGSETFTGIV